MDGLILFVVFVWYILFLANGWAKGLQSEAEARSAYFASLPKAEPVSSISDAEYYRY